MFKKRFRRYIPVELTLCLGFGLSALAAFTAGQWEKVQMQRDFQQEADNLTTTLQQKIESYSSVVEAVSAYYTAADTVTPASYEIFTQSLLAYHPEVTALAWAVPISNAQRTTYETSLEARGVPYPYINEQNPQGEIIPATQREEYFPLQYAQQADRIGFDATSTTLGQIAINKARTTGGLVTTSQYRSPNSEQIRVSIMKASYHSTGSADNPQSFQGVSIGVFLIDEILQNAFDDLKIQDLDLYVYDRAESAEDALLAIYQSQTQEAITTFPDNLAQADGGWLCRDDQHCNRVLKIADRQWKLVMVPTASYTGIEIPVKMALVFGAGLLLTGVSVVYLLKSMHYVQQIETEQEKSESLLLNILPRQIADRLKQNQKVIADSFPEATVLFADIVNFTPLSKRISPTELVKFLNEIFSTFDQLTEKYSLEKIKTIGDAYMVAGGIPVPQKDNCLAVADMALEMQQELKRISDQSGESFNIRIGIHTGPVVAGVIGTKKFIYDLWGDTVNTASRMESHGIAGGIQVTEVTYEFLKEQYNFEDRGVITVKGKGEMKAYLLLGKKAINDK